MTEFYDFSQLFQNVFDDIHDYSCIIDEWDSN